MGVAEILLILESLVRLSELVERLAKVSNLPPHELEAYEAERRIIRRKVTDFALSLGPSHLKEAKDEHSTDSSTGGPAEPVGDGSPSDAGV